MKPPECDCGAAPDEPHDYYCAISIRERLEAVFDRFFGTGGATS